MASSPASAADPCCCCLLLRLDRCWSSCWGCPPLRQAAAAPRRHCWRFPTCRHPTPAARPPLPPARPRSMKGIPELQAAMAGVLERFLVPGHAVDPGNVCISAGAWVSSSTCLLLGPRGLPPAGLLVLQGPTQPTPRTASAAATYHHSTLCCMHASLPIRLQAAAPSMHASLPIRLQAAAPSWTTRFTACATMATACSSPRPTTPLSTTTCRQGPLAAGCGFGIGHSACCCCAVCPPAGSAAGRLLARHAPAATCRAMRLGARHHALLHHTTPPRPQAKCCVHPLPFYLSEEAAAGGLSIRQQLDAAVQDAASFGVPVKVGRAARACGFGTARHGPNRAASAEAMASVHAGAPCRTRPCRRPATRNASSYLLTSCHDPLALSIARRRCW